MPEGGALHGSAGELLARGAAMARAAGAPRMTLTLSARKPMHPQAALGPLPGQDVVGVENPCEALLLQSR
jgi:hypothetical protein